MPECKTKGKEQGIWFEIKSVADIIKLKESKCEDATFERELLKSWSSHKGYEGAKQALADCNNQTTRRG